MTDLKQMALDNFQKITEFQIMRIVTKLFQGQKIDVDVKPLTTENLRYFDHIVFICIMNKDIRITFRTHFLDPEAQEFWRHANKKSHLDISSMKVVDHLKEFCNILSGSVRAVLSESNINVGQSLPVYVSGFNELFFDAIFQSRYQRSSVFQFANISFVSSINIEFLQASISEQIANLPCDFDELVPTLESF